MKKYSYDEFSIDCKKLSQQIKADFKPACIVAISRGGLSLAQRLGHLLGIRAVFCINASLYNDQQKSTLKIYNIPNLSGFENALICDDIVDSGQTLLGVLDVLRQNFNTCELKTASLFYKKSAQIKPDYFINFTDEWVEFAWEAL